MAQKLVYVCNCGCNSHRIYENGETECSNCGVITNNHAKDVAEWVKASFPEPNYNTERDTHGTFTVSAFSHQQFAKASVMRDINNWSKADNLICVMAYKPDGTGRHWLNIITQKDKDRVIELLSSALEYVKKTSVSDET